MSQPKRTRDPEGKRAAILDAARAVFAEYGYEKSTIREIARRAGVTHGLIVLHFATKENLFFAALPSPSFLTASIPGDLEGLPARVAKAYVERMESTDAGSRFVAVVRSAVGGQHTAIELLRDMREASLAEYQRVMTAPDTPERVDMIAATVIGIVLSRYVLRTGPVATMPRDELIDRLTRTLRTIIFD